MRLRSLPICLALMGAIVFALGTGPALAQNNPQDHSQHHPEAEPPKAEQAKDGMAACKEMMAQRESMMQRMVAMDKKLDDLVIQINQAKGNQKIDAVAKAVTELVAQRKQMNSEMMQMQDRMMSHMMTHMQSGSMANCPMMKGMIGGDQPTK